ncbi:MAG: hypothetical protein QXD48_01305 [Candidatus Aenigmatarchaeota archaeon]
MNKIYILLIVVLIFVSGCIGGGQVKVDANNGLTINEFSADPIIAEPDDFVRFFLDIENVGGTTARCITAELFGVESWYDEYGQSFTYSTPWRDRGVIFNYIDGALQFSYWDLNKGFVNLAYDRYGGIGLSTYVHEAWDNFVNNFCGSYSALPYKYKDIKYWDSMSPPYPERNRPGQSFTTEWVLRPPILPEGTHAQYPITARVSYLYTTTALINIMAFNKDEYKRRIDSGEPITPYTIDNSQASPIKVVPTRLTAPIVVNDRMPGYELANYLIELQNVGNGWPLPMTNNNGESGFMFAVVTLNGPGAFFYDCLGQTSGTEAFIYGDVIGQLIKLRSDRRAPFGCTIGIDRSKWINNPIGTISLTFEIYYRYYIDKEIMVTVNGLERF